MVNNLGVVLFLILSKSTFSNNTTKKVNKNNTVSNHNETRKNIYIQYVQSRAGTKGQKEESEAVLRMGSQDSQEDIKAILEANYRFKSDSTAKRFKITSAQKEEAPYDAKNDASWAFRTFAVRRIVGGMETSISMYPYNVAISRNGRHWCGGSIIDEQWVLTAGHCFESAHDGDKKKLNAFIIRAGSSFHARGGYQARVNKYAWEEKQLEHSMCNFICQASMEEKYSPGNADFDFSLLRLDRPMPIGRNIAVLNLPSKDYVIKPADILIVTGWGSTHESGAGHIAERLRFVPVPAMRLSECQAAYRFYITPRMMCAGYATGGKDACNHDSGGPAVRDGVLLGIVSFGGKQCGDPHSPGVYSRVSEMTSWVENTISNNEASTVPELREKIQQARSREKDLQRFKARVEDKKNKIKNWLRETLKSPKFIELAKKKLSEAQAMRRSFSETLVDEKSDSSLDDTAMDDINLSNLIHDRILEGDDENEDENMLNTLALRDIMMNEDKVDGANETFNELMEFIVEDDPPSENVTVKS